MGKPKNYTGEKTIIQPFSFETDRRVSNKTKQDPFLIIELVIAPGRKAKVPLYNPDTLNADEIAHNISLTFNLSKKAKSDLIAVIERHIKPYQIPPSSLKKGISHSSSRKSVRFSPSTLIDTVVLQA